MYNQVWSVHPLNLLLLLPVGLLSESSPWQLMCTRVQKHTALVHVIVMLLVLCPAPSMKVSMTTMQCIATCIAFYFNFSLWPSSYPFVSGLDFPHPVLQNATEELERLGYAFDAVKKQLLGRLHELARKQIGFEPGRPSSPLPHSNGAQSPVSAGSKTPTGMPEITNAVAATFVDQHDGSAVR